jgi:hypothetical protein
MFDNNTETKFQSAGTLPPPGPIGRSVRVVLGLGCLYFVWQIFYYWPSMVESESLFGNGSFLFMALFGLYLSPYVINIGWKLNTKRWPQVIIVVISALFMGYNYYALSQINSPLFNTLTLIWLSYIYFHLGVSLVISAIISTPGCEMRSIGHLYSIFTGNKIYEHSCPGPLNKIDKWERSKSRE